MSFPPRSPRPDRARRTSKRGLRTGLLARTALSGVVAALSGAGLAHGGPTGASTPAGVASPTVTTSGSTTDVKLNQSRTIIDWTNFGVDKTETLNFLFSDKSWIVLNRTPGTARIDGALNGCVVTCGTVGGNVWIFGGQGVIFGPNARVNVGSLLATTSPLSSDTDFLSGKSTDFTFAGGADMASVRVQAGAVIAAHGGALALVAPSVETDAGSTLQAKGTALVGAAQTYRIRFDATAGGDLDLIDFEVPASALTDGTVSATPLAVNGAVAGQSVVLAAVSRPSVMNALISIGGTVTATKAASGEGGDIVLTGAGSAGAAVDVSGTLQAAGGHVDVTAPAVSLEGRIDVSAPGGGGVVRLGGGSRGQDPTIADADTLTVAPGAVIDASATTAGDGGTVTLWSNAATDFHGTILSLGGPGGGNGGNAEVSGGWLNYAGSADLRAPKGAFGTLLLDPDTVNITTGAAPAPVAVLTANAGSATTNNSGGANPTNLSVGQINTALDSADVTISTTNNGKITFNDGTTDYVFDHTTATPTHTAGLLSFVADNGFTFLSTQAITAKSGISLSFDAQGNAFTADTAISTTAAGTAAATTAGSITLSGTSVAVNKAVTAGTGATGENVTLTATAGGVSQAASSPIAADLLTVAATSNGGVAGSSVSATGGVPATVSLAGSQNKVRRFTAATHLDAGGDALPGDTSITLDNTGASSPLQIAAAGVSSVRDNVTLTSGNDITEAGGATVTANNLSVSSVSGSTTLDQNNNVKTLLAAFAPAGKTVSFTNNAALTLGNITSQGGLAVTTTSGKNLTVGDDLVIHQDLTLTATNAALGTTGTPTIQTFGNYVVTADSFSGGANSPELSPTLSGAASGFSITQTSTSGFNLNNIGTKTVPGTLSVTASGAVSDSGSATFTGAAISVTGTSLAAGNLDAAGLLTLHATTGDIAQNGGGVLTAATLSATADLGQIGLTNPDNAVGQITTLSAATGQSASFTDAGGFTVANGATLAGGSLSLTSRTGGIEFLGAFTLPADLTVSAGTSTTFDSTVDGGKNLVSTAGTLVFDSTVGAGAPLSSLTADAGASFGGDVTTTGAIQVTGSTTLNASVTLATTNSNVTLGAVDAAVANSQGLVVSDGTGATTLGGAVGGGKALGSLTLNGTGTTDIGANITAQNAVQLNHAVTLTGNSFITSNAGAVAFGSTVDSDGTARALTVASGPASTGTTFGGAVGATHALASFAANGPTNLSANINTTGVLTLNGATTLTGSPTLTSSAGVVTVAGTLNADVANTRTLTLAGATVAINGAVGASAAPNTLTITGPASLAANVTTGSGGLSVSGLSTLKTNLVTLTAGTGGTVALAGADSDSAFARSLVVVAPGFTTSAALGGTNGLAGLGLNASTATLTTGNQIATLALNLTGAAPFSLSDPVTTLTVGAVGGVTGITTAGQNVSLTNGTGAIAVNAPVAIGAGGLTLNAGTSITQDASTAAGAPITAATLSATGPAGVSLTSAGNLVGTLSTLSSTGGNAAFVDDQALTVSAGLTEGGGLTLQTLTGDLTATAGPLTANGGALGLTAAAGNINAGSLTSSGDMTLHAGGAGSMVTTTGESVGGSYSLYGASFSTPALSPTFTGAPGTTHNYSVEQTTGNVLLDSFTTPTGTSALTVVADGGSITQTGAGALVKATSINLDATGGSVMLSGAGLQATAAGGAIQLTAGIGVVSGTAPLTADKLDAVATGGVSLTGVANNVGELVRLQGGAGAAAFADAYAGNLVVDGGTGATGASSGASVTISNTAGGIALASGAATPTATVASGSGAVTLTATNGSVTQSANALVSGPTLSVSGVGITLTDANQITTSAGLAGGTGAVSFTDTAAGALAVTGATSTSASGITLVNPNGLHLTGAVSDGSGPVTLTATSGLVDQLVGITAASLSATGGAGVTLTAAGTANAVQTLAQLADTSAGGVGASFSDGVTTLQVNQASSAHGAVGITNSGAMTVAGDVTAAGMVSLSTTPGALTQTAGTISGASIGLSGAGGVSVAGALAAGSGVVTLTSTGGTVATTGSIGGGSATLAGATGVSLAGTVNAGAGTATFNSSNGSVTQTGGLVTAGTVTGSAGAANGGFALNGAGAGTPNAFGQLGAVTAGTGGIALTTSTGLELTAPVSTTGAAILSAAGAITQDAGGTITAASLSATGAGVTLGQANAVSTLTQLSDTGATGATFNDATAALTVDAASSGGVVTITNAGAGGGSISTAGAVTGTTVTLESQTGLTLDADVGQAGGGLVLKSDTANIVQSGGALTGATLSATGATGVALTSGTNVVDTTILVGGSGAVSFTDASAGVLTVTGATSSSAGGITLVNPNGLSLTGAVTDASGPVSLSASAGAIGQSGTGVVTAASLGATGAGVTLGLANVVGTLTQLADTGATGATFKDAAGALTVDAASSTGGAVTITNTGPVGMNPTGVLTVAGNVTAAGAVTLSTTPGALSQTAGTISGASIGLSGAGGVSVGGVLAAGSGPVTLTSTGGTVTQTGGLIAGGSATLAGATGVSLAGTVNVGAGGLLTLTSSGGSVAQTGGAITAGTVTGSAAGPFTLGTSGSAAFGTLGTLTTTASGGVTLADTTGLMVASVVSSAGALAITAPSLTLLAIPVSSLTAPSATLTATGAGGLILSGNITTTGLTRLIGQAGPVDQTGGVISAGSLQASGVGGVTLTDVSTGAITGLSNTGSGAVDVTLAAPVTIGAVSNSGGAVDIEDTGGALAFTGAVSASGPLTLAASGALSGTSAGSTGGATSLTGAGIAFSGAAAAGAGLTANAGGGSASFGSISAGQDVAVSAAGAVGVAGALNVGRDLTLTGASFSGNALAPTFAAGTGRDFLLTDTAGGLAYSTLAAPRNLTVIASDPGAGDAAPISGGALTAGTGAVSVTGTSLALSGAIGAPAGVGLTATFGGITLGGATQAGASAATLTAAGAIVEGSGGSVSGATLTANAGAGITLGGANAVPTVSLVNSGGGGVLFNDAATATTVSQVSTGAGDITLTAPGGALTLATDPQSPGALTLSAAGALSGGALTAQGALSATGAGVSLSGNASGSSVTIAAGSGAASLQNVAAASGAATLSGGSLSAGNVTGATNVGLTFAGAMGAGAVTATGGALTVSGGAVTLASGTAGTNATITSQGAVIAPTLAAGGALAVTATGALQSTTLTASTGALSVQAGAISATGASAGGAATLATPGTLTLATLAARGPATVSAGTLQLGTGTSVGDASLAATGAETLGSFTAGGALTDKAGGALTATSLTAGSTLSATAGGALQATTLVATTGAVTLAAAGPLTVQALTAGANASVTGAQGVTLGQVQAGGSIAATAGGAGAPGAFLTLGSATAGQDLTLALTDPSGAGPLSTGMLTAGRNLSVTANTPVTVGGIKTGAAGDVSIKGLDVTLGASAGAAPTAANTFATGAATTFEAAATRDLSVNLTGPVAFSRLDATRNLSVTVGGGDLSAAELSSGGAFSVATPAGSARLGTLSLTGAGPDSVSAGTDVVLGQGFAGATLAAPAGALTVSAGRDATIAYPGAVSLAKVTAGRNLALASTGAAVTAPTLQAGGDISVSGASLGLTTVTAGGGFTGAAATGAATVDSATVGGDFALTAAAGTAALRTLHATGAVAGARTVTVSASGEASIGAASDGAATGALTLDAPSREAVNVLSTGAGAGLARVDVTGDATLARVSSASGAVLVRAAGAVDGAPTGAALFSAATDLTVTAGGPITMGGLSTAGGGATLSAGGLLTLASLTADHADLRATDLTLTGGVQATQACSPACAAPTLIVESRTGLLTLGSAPSGVTFASGGLTVDNTELGLLKGDSVALYAGDTTSATARGDLQVGNVTFDAGAIKSLSLFAGPANTVRVAGVVAPKVANTGVLIIGGAKSATGWTPKSIYVTGSLGASGSGPAVAGAALSSVTLDAVQDVLIGSQTFVNAVSKAETPDANAALANINITRGQPIGVQALGPDLNRNIISTGVLALRSDGFIVSQNTGSTGQQGGVLITNPTRQTTVLTLGRVGTAGPSLTPELIDLSLNFYTASGTLITRQVAATSLAIQNEDLSRSDNYRVNGCTIGVAGSCTPLPNTIVDIRINKLVEGVQIAAEDPPAIDDPTITGTGNEEIWRSPACTPSKGHECR